MKFEYIGPNCIELVDGKAVESPANSYGGVKVNNGDRVELDGVFAEKALKNPNYRQVKPGPKKKVKVELPKEEVKIDVE